MQLYLPTLPILPIKMHSLQSLSFPYSILSPSFNQQLCFDFHLRLFVARCTFHSFQWYSKRSTCTAGPGPFDQGLLTPVLAIPSLGFSPILHLLQAVIVKIHNWTALPHGRSCMCCLALSFSVSLSYSVLYVCLFICVCVCVCQVLFQCAIASRKSSLIIQELLMSWIFIKFWAWFDFIAYFTLTSTPSAIKTTTTTRTTISRVLSQPEYSQCACKSLKEPWAMPWYMYDLLSFLYEQPKPKRKYDNI